MLSVVQEQAAIITGIPAGTASDCYASRRPDPTPRYDEAAAELAWERTIAFFDANLKS